MAWGRYITPARLGLMDYQLFSSLVEGEPAALDEPSSFEYRLVACPDASVAPGATYVAACEAVKAKYPKP